MTATAAATPLRSLGNYDLLDKIADGGIGSVHKGRNRTTGELVAVKVLEPLKTRGDDILLKRFEQEFHAARALDHPHVVRALDFGREGTAAYLVLELVDGESLGARIERQGPLPEDEAVRLVVQIGQALDAIHERGMVHRDVKPDNILLSTDGRARLTDLGLVKDAGTELNLTRTGRGLGTPHFMAPEQFRNAKQADPRYDVYGLAATLYMAVTGALPFAGCGPMDAYMRKLGEDLAPPRELVPGLSSRVDEAIRRAMSADPDKRPRSCAAFIADLTGSGGDREQAGAAADAPPDARSGEADPLRIGGNEAGPHAPRCDQPAHPAPVMSPLLPVRASGPGKQTPAFDKPATNGPTPRPAPSPVPAVEVGMAPAAEERFPWAVGAAMAFLVGVFSYWLWILSQ
jgi:serine/threonine protein kinase